MFFLIVICNGKVIDAKPRRLITQTEFPDSVEMSLEQAGITLAGSSAAPLPHRAALTVGPHGFQSEVGRSCCSWLSAELPAGVPGVTPWSWSRKLMNVKQILISLKR